MAWKKYSITDEEIEAFFHMFERDKEGSMAYQEIREYCMAYKEIYMGLGPRRQGELGYLLSWMRADQGAVSPHTESYRDFILGRNYVKTPIQFCGWAGKNSDVGPAYQLSELCLGDEKAPLFYTDNDISTDREAAASLARGIMRESSGLANFRLVEFGNALGSSYGWGIIVHLDETRIKEKVIIGGRVLEKNETGGYIFVLPRAGEFVCTLGEMHDGAPRPLAKHSFCMK